MSLAHSAEVVRNRRIGGRQRVHIPRLRIAQYILCLSHEIGLSKCTRLTVMKTPYGHPGAAQWKALGPLLPLTQRGWRWRPFAIQAGKCDYPGVPAFGGTGRGTGFAGRPRRGRCWVLGRIRTRGTGETPGQVCILTIPDDNHNSNQGGSD